MVSLKTDDFKLDNIKLVIFDKDGTFIDIHTYWGRVVELRATKIIQYFALNDSFFKPLCDVMGYDINLKKLPPDSPVGLYARGKVQEILLYYLQSQKIEASLEDIERIFLEVSQEFIVEQEKYTVVIPEAVALMAELKKSGVKMIVITSDSQANAIHTIEKNNLSEFFSLVYGAENSSEPKTTGDIVKKALAEIGENPLNTICLGDTFDDFLMAKNSNLKACINVSTGVVTSEQQKEFNKFCVNSLSEISVVI